MNYMIILISQFVITQMQSSRISIHLGTVRLQTCQIEYEMKVRQKERVPSQFGTRLWHGRMQYGGFRLKRNLNMEFQATY